MCGYCEDDSNYNGGCSAGLNSILLERENELAKVKEELASLEPYKVS